MYAEFDSSTSRARSSADEWVTPTVVGPASDSNTTLLTVAGPDVRALPSGGCCRDLSDGQRALRARLRDSVSTGSSELGWPKRVVACIGMSTSDERPSVVELVSGDGPEHYEWSANVEWLSNGSLVLIGIAHLPLETVMYARGRRYQINSWRKVDAGLLVDLAG